MINEIIEGKLQIKNIEIDDFEVFGQIDTAKMEDTDVTI